MIIRNFLFHRVSHVRDLLWDPISPEKFDAIIMLISKKFHVLNLENYLSSESTETFPKPLATISFDDGYKDNIEFAADILTKYHCPASFYITTGCIENNIPVWTYSIDYLFQNTANLTLEFNKDGIPENLKKTVWVNKKDRVEYAKKLKPYLKTINNCKRVSIISSIESSFNDVSSPLTMMNWKDINALVSSDFSIGSHTVSHPVLSSLEDEVMLVKELKNSAKIIAEKTGKYPLSISYPFGCYNSQVIDYAKKSGYKLGLSVKQRIFNSLK